MAPAHRLVRVLGEWCRPRAGSGPRTRRRDARMDTPSARRRPSGSAGLLWARRRAQQCRTCDDTVCGPPLNTHCRAFDRPATVRISTKRHWTDLRADWCKGCSLNSCGGSNRPLELVSMARTAPLIVPAATVFLNRNRSRVSMMSPPCCPNVSASSSGPGRSCCRLFGSVPRKWLTTNHVAAGSCPVSTAY